METIIGACVFIAVGLVYFRVVNIQDKIKELNTHEPLLEIIKAQKEMIDILFKGWHNEEDMTDYPASLENKIEELTKQIQ